jgi:hypothetical protein
VRTSADPECHVLHLLPLKATNGIAALWLDFEPFELLINDQWAITSVGLESVGSALAYPVSWAGFMGGGGAAVWHRTTLRGPTDPPADAREGWDEALRWVTEREGGHSRSRNSPGGQVRIGCRVL